MPDTNPPPATQGTERAVGNSYAHLVKRLVIRSVHDDECATLQPIRLDWETLEPIKEPTCDCGAEDDAAAAITLAAHIERAENLISGKEQAKYWGKESDELLTLLAAGYHPPDAKEGKDNG